MKNYEWLDLSCVELQELKDWLAKHDYVKLNAFTRLIPEGGSEVRIIFYNTDENGNMEKGKIDPFYFLLKSVED